MLKSTVSMFEVFEVAVLLELLMPIGIATLAGALIGIERECRSKSAGFRTMIIISVGACLFTLMSEALGGPDKESSRIAAQIVTGIGFLGAGVILKDGITVRGLTTAASIWLSASLGLAAAVEAYEAVAIVTGIALIVLWLLPPIDRLFERAGEYAILNITIKNTDTAEDNILDILDECRAKIITIRRSILNKGERTLHIRAKMKPKNHDAFSEIIVNEKGVIRIEY
jgi:putative Mg2+ transporter-C (MgtC) family protein